MTQKKKKSKATIVTVQQSGGTVKAKRKRRALAAPINFQSAMPGPVPDSLNLGRDFSRLALDNLTKARRMVASRVREGHLTPDGAKWLVLALDPFHDLNEQVAGYPDADCSSTVVRQLNYEYDIGAPLGANAWDAHVYVNQALSFATEEEYKTNATASVTDNALAPGKCDGILKITTCSTGEKLAPPPGAAYAPANGAFNTLGSYSDLLQNNSRIIGLGFEIINTSAEIYKQGTILCYKQPQSASLGNIQYTNNAGTANGVCATRIIKEAPSTTSIAAKLHGSVSWEAGKGAMIVCTQMTTNNDLHSMDYIPTLRSVEDGHIGDAAGDYVHGTKVTFATVATPTNILFPAGTNHGIKFMPFNTHGAMITGLNEASTLHVRLRVYLEQAPGINANDSSFVSLATPSAAYDFGALSAYSQVCARMPVAVPVQMNAMGDWFKLIAHELGRIVLPAGKAVVSLATGTGKGLLDTVEQQSHGFLDSLM